MESVFGVVCTSILLGVSGGAFAALVTEGAPLWAWLMIGSIGFGALVAGLTILVFVVDDFLYERDLRRRRH